MRLPRMTTRRWMVAVAVVGIALAVTFERRDRFRKIAVHHRAEFMKLIPKMNKISYQGDDPLMLLMEWHESMRLKYERAALRPWFPVRPDPPMPEPTAQR